VREEGESSSGSERCVWQGANLRQSEVKKNLTVAKNSARNRQLFRCGHVPLP
jgi:hypothetical protein